MITFIIGVIVGIGLTVGFIAHVLSDGNHWGPKF